MGVNKHGLKSLIVGWHPKRYKPLYKNMHLVFGIPDRTVFYYNATFMPAWD